ncbi:MAG: hypothetical protein MUE73_10550, partial [Planctomycetes bacterium]|nr:hypothetical protein [Planctomycetota bacterium]
RLYGEVAGDSLDAREAHRLLTERRLVMPEVLRGGPGEEPSLPVTLKNVPAADLVLHRIDLLLYFTLAKDTEKMRELDLAGIRPALARTVAPAAAALGMEETVAIGLGKLEPGVYLAIARAGAEEARTVIIVSDLAARVWRHSQGARVLVTDRRTGAAMEGAFVKLVVGGALLAEGLTDARGFFEARIDPSHDIMEGSAAPKAVAEKNGHYALAP